MWRINEHTDAHDEHSMLTPTAPERSGNEDTSAQDAEVQPPMIQCTVHPARGTVILAAMGAATIITLVITTMTMLWMVAQGYAMPGVWLTITPTHPYQNKPDDDNNYGSDVELCNTNPTK